MGRAQRVTYRATHLDFIDAVILLYISRPMPEDCAAIIFFCHYIYESNDRYERANEERVTNLKANEREYVYPVHFESLSTSSNSANFS